MKQILIELDDDTVARLEAIAPARSRKRSDFIRFAIRRAIWDRDEAEIEASYRARPDDEPVYFDAEAWEVREPRPTGSRKPRAQK